MLCSRPFLSALIKTRSPLIRLLSWPSRVGLFLVSYYAAYSQLFDACTQLQEMTLAYFSAIERDEDHSLMELFKLQLTADVNPPIFFWRSLVGPKLGCSGRGCRWPILNLSDSRDLVAQNCRNIVKSLMNRWALATTSWHILSLTTYVHHLRS